MSTPPKKSRPFHKKSHPRKFLNHPLTESFSTPTRKFLNPTTKFSQPLPPKKFSTTSQKFFKPPPPKISQTLLKISQHSKNILTGNPLPITFLSLFIYFYRFSFTFQKKSKNFGGGVEPPEHPPPLKYALDVTVFQSAYFNDQNSLTKYHSSINYGC